MARTKGRNLALFGAGMALLVLVAVVTAAVVMIVSAANRGSDSAKGIDVRCEAEAGDYSGRLDVDQAENAALIATVAREKRLPGRAVTIALATAMQESGIRNLDYGDRDSLGMFQQRPSQGWGSEEQVQDPVYAAGIFFDHLVKVPGYQDLPITVAAQEVQRSAYPDAYAKHESMARAFASALTGTAPASLTCVLEPADPGADPKPLARALGQSFTGARIEPSVGPVGEGLLTVRPDAGGKAGETARWAIAHWAVVEAQRYGIVEVAVGDQLWRRDTGTWQTSTRVPVRPGDILITLSAPPPPSPTP